MQGSEIDWTKVREVVLALLWLGRRPDRREVPCTTAEWLIETFFEDGLLTEPRATLGTVEFTEDGVIEAVRMLRKHFEVTAETGRESAMETNA